MELAKIEIDNVSAKFLTKHPIPCGVVGATINVRFMQSWNGLSKSAVFRYHGKQITQKITDNNITIPSECTEHVGERVWLGIIGTESSSPSLTPTVWADLGIVVDAADNTGDPAINPTLPIWAEIDAKIGDMSSLKTNNKDNIVSAINEVHDNSGGPGGEKEVIISTTEPPADGPESVWINPNGEPFSAADVPAVVPEGVTAAPNVQSVLDAIGKPEGKWELIETINIVDDVKLARDFSPYLKCLRVVTSNTENASNPAFAIFHENQYSATLLASVYPGNYSDGVVCPSNGYFCYIGATGNDIYGMRNYSGTGYKHILTVPANQKITKIESVGTVSSGTQIKIYGVKDNEAHD